MPTVTITVLCKDFKDNSYLNIDLTEEGCPIQRAFIRQGIIKPGEDYQDLVRFDNDLDLKVTRMFTGEEPIADFTMDLEIRTKPQYFTPAVIDEL